MSTDETPPQGAAAPTETPAPAMMIDIVSTDTIAVRGELDLSTADQLYGSALPLIDQTAGTFTIDLAGLFFCDSTGLTTFIRLHQCLQSRGRQLHLAHPSEPVRRILAITALDQALAID